MAQHSAPTDSRTANGGARSSIIKWAVGGVALVLVVVLGFVLLGGGGGTSTSVADADGAPVVDAGNLQVSSTYTEITAAPADPDPTGTTDGTVVHPIRNTPVHDAPDGAAVAQMETQQFGDTWLPMIGEQDGWVQVLLPSKPAST